MKKVERPLSERLKEIDAEVLGVLGKQKGDVLVVKDARQFEEYVGDCIKTGFVDVDTETNNSLDPLTCSIMGLCLYAPGLKQAYVPVNHRDPTTKARLPWQLTENDLRDQLAKLKESGVKVIMHNGKFDYEVIKCTCGIELPPYWDTMIAAKLLNENESAGLKQQYVGKVDKSQAEYKIDGLFKGVAYADVNPDTFALYAATDSMMTHRLYEIQEPALQKLKTIRNLFFDIEMPMVTIAAKMELYGALADVEYAKRLQNKYETKLAEIDKDVQKELVFLGPTVEKWKNGPKGQLREMVFPSKKVKAKTDARKFEKIYDMVDEATGERFKFGKRKKDLLDNPVKVSSPKQLSILFFDVFEVPPLLSIHPIGTGKYELDLIGNHFKELEDEILFCLKNKRLKDLDYKDVEDGEEDERSDLKRYRRAMRLCENFVEDGEEESLKNGIKIAKSAGRLCDLLLKRREVDKLISTYLKVVPALAAHWGDGKIRFQLSSLGARTGRFSSGGKWKFLVGDKQVSLSGMNAQNIPSKNHEVRLIFKAEEGRVFVGGDFSQQEPKITAFLSQDPKMLETYNQGKDIYAVIAQSIYGNRYEDNLEFFDKEKKRINLEGKERRSVGKVVILATMYGMGPATLARQLGVPRLEAEEMLEKFFEDFTEVKKAIVSSQALCRAQGYIDTTLKGYCRRRRLPNIQLPKYRAAFITTPQLGEEESSRILLDYLAKTRTKDGGFMPGPEFSMLKKEALRHNIVIESNEYYIKKAERQCFNSRIQGSAATLTKKTMILIARDPVLNELDAHMVFQIHDELILDCPIQNSERVKERLNEIMVRSVDTLGITVGMKCDVVTESRWGEEAMAEELRVDYSKLQSERRQNPLDDLCKEYPNFPKESVEKVIKGEAQKLEFSFMPDKPEEDQKGGKNLDKGQKIAKIS